MKSFVYTFSLRCARDTGWNNLKDGVEFLPANEETQVISRFFVARKSLDMTLFIPYRLPCSLPGYINNNVSAKASHRPCALNDDI